MHKMVFNYEREAPDKIERDVLRDLHDLGISARHARKFKGGRVVSIVYPVGREREPQEFELGITPTQAYIGGDGELPRRLKEILHGIF